jgi:hypothetical protein
MNQEQSPHQSYCFINVKEAAVKNLDLVLVKYISIMLVVGAMSVGR